MIRTAVTIGAFLLLGACTAMPPVTTREKVPAGSEIAVVMFRDCLITGQDDCDESGLTAGSVFAQVLSQNGGMCAAPLSRPVSAKMQLDDTAAAEYAKAKGYQYVLNGEVEDYYRVAPMTFRTERAGVSVRLLRADGQLMAFFSDRTRSQTNLTTPDALLRSMAIHFRDAITAAVPSAERPVR